MNDTVPSARQRPASARRLLRIGAAIGGVALLSMTLTACLKNAVNLAATSDLTCSSWTLTPNAAVAGPGTSVGDPGDDITYFTRVIDGDGHVLHESEAVDVFEVPVDPIVVDFAGEPTAGPIIAGVYTKFGGVTSVLIEQRAEYATGCASLPFAADLRPGIAVSSPSTSLPYFDVMFAEKVTGFTTADLVFGGTAEVTGATIAPIPGSEHLEAFPVPLESVPSSLYDVASFYRIAVTSMGRDGAITLQIPAGAVAGPYGDVNAASRTLTAVVDRTGPIIAGADAISRVLPAGSATTTVDWEVTATDPAGVGSQSCTPVSGSTFGLGDTPVTCTATDALGNSSTASFEVSVRTTPSVAIGGTTDGVDQGGTAQFTVTATDALGASAPLLASDYTVASDVRSDVIETEDGRFSVTFPHASPHALTVTQTSTGATARVVVEVRPAVVRPTPTPTTTPTTTPTPTTTSAPTATGPGGGSTNPTTAPPKSGLAATGADSTPLIVAAGVLVVLGGLLLVVRAVLRRRREGESAEDADTE